MAHNLGDQMLADMFASLELNVDGKAIASALRKRGFEGAQFVVAALATAAMMESGIDDVEHAINVGVDEMNRRSEAAITYLEQVKRRFHPDGPSFID